MNGRRAALRFRTPNHHALSNVNVRSCAGEVKRIRCLAPHRLSPVAPLSLWVHSFCRPTCSEPAHLLLRGLGRSVHERSYTPAPTEGPPSFWACVPFTCTTRRTRPRRCRGADPRKVSARRATADRVVTGLSASPLMIGDCGSQFAALGGDPRGTVSWRLAQPPLQPRWRQSGNGRWRRRDGRGAIGRDNVCRDGC